MIYIVVQKMSSGISKL